MAAFIDVCRFNPTLGGTTDWTFSTAVLGYQSPTAANAVNGAIYRYRAESVDLAQWEIGYGAYTSGTGVFARTTVLYNSIGTTAKISFTVPPQVGIVMLAEDFKAAGDIPGTATNDSASAGSIGEYVTSTLAFASRVTLTSAVTADITSISLTAGDWDVDGTCYGIESSGVPTGNAFNEASISQTATTLSGVDGEYFYLPPLIFAAASFSTALGPVRKSLASTTTIYLVAQFSFTAGTFKAYGQIRARRVR